MVKGLETFRRAMAPYKDHFVIIGGTACDIRLTGTTMIPRATDDIDIIVVIDRLTNDFVHAIWQFVKDGNYKAGKRVNKQGVNIYALYRFTLQDDSLDYPKKIEILSRHSDLLVNHLDSILNLSRRTKNVIVCRQSSWTMIITTLPSIRQKKIMA